MDDQDTYFYRYRSAQAVLDGFHELERGEIFFSATNELNDPMEGFKDLVWSGDEIVWRNLLRHYILCILQAAGYCILAGDEFDPDALKNIVFWTPQRLPDAPIRAVYEQASSEFLADPAAKGFLSLMAKREIPVRRNELTAYLRALHGFALQSVFKEFREQGILGSSPQNASSSLWPEYLRQRAMAMMEGVTQIEESPESPAERISDTVFTANEALVAQMLLLHEYRLPERDKQVAILALTHQFPATYVGALDRLVHRDWYVACFAKTPNNHSMWSIYAAGHRGVCLKFKATPNPEGRPTLGIERIAGARAAIDTEATADFIPRILEPVSYSGEYPSVDFFRSLSSLRETDVNDFWYRGEGEKFSTCREAVSTDTETFRSAYWQAFRESALCKTPEWALEKEFRIIIHPAFDMRARESRKLRYRFEDLVGIVFGVRTNWEDRLKVMRIVGKRCADTDRTDFQFYEVRYLHRESRFQLFPLDLLSSGVSLRAPNPT